MFSFSKSCAWGLALCLTTVVTAEQSVPAVPGAALEAGQVLKTGRDGSVGVTLKDSTLLSSGANTEFAGPTKCLSKHPPA